MGETAYALVGSHQVVVKARLTQLSDVQGLAGANSVCGHSSSRRFDCARLHQFQVT